MVALLCNGQRNGTINKTKQKNTAERQRGEINRRKKGNFGETIIIEKIRCVTGGLLEFLSSFPVLAPIVKTPRGDGVFEGGPGTRS